MLLLHQKFGLLDGGSAPTMRQAMRLNKIERVSGTIDQHPDLAKHSLKFQYPKQLNLPENGGRSYPDESG